MYVSSLGIVRATKARCSMVRKILRNLSVRSAPVSISLALLVNVVCRVYERDVFMSRDHCMDLKERLDVQQVNLPQVFIHGHLLGVSMIRRSQCSAVQWEQLNKNNEIVKYIAGSLANLSYRRNRKILLHKNVTIEIFRAQG